MIKARLKKRGNWFLIALIFCSLFQQIIPTYALEKTVVINEIYSNPDEGEKEWIELYNVDDLDIDLSGYSLVDQTNQSFILDGYGIAGNGFLLLKKDEDFKFALNNDSDKLFLFKDDVLVDSVSYGNGQDAPVPEKGKSINRIPDGYDTDNDDKDFELALPSPGEEHKNLIYSKKIIINEIFPSPPDGSENEFIEILNDDSEDINLTGWQIDDLIGGGSNPYVIEEVKIKSGQYISFFNVKTGISLNDAGDQVNLIDPNGEIVDSVSYNNIEKNKSYSRFDSDWSWQNPTPEKENIIEQLKHITISISEAKRLDNDEEAIIRGTITALPGILSDQYMYIQDENAGIQIYSYNKKFPSLNLGDYIEVKGKLSTISGERRIKIFNDSDLTILSTNCCVSPFNIPIDEIDEDLIGFYIGVRGVVSEKGTASFVINFGDTEIKVLLRDGSGLKTNVIKRGNEVEVFGVLSSYNGSYRILPTRQNDVRIINQGKELPRVGVSASFWIYWLSFSLIIYLTIVLWNIFLGVKKILSTSQEKLQILCRLVIFLRLLEI